MEKLTTFTARAHPGAQLASGSAKPAPCTAGTKFSPEANRGRVTLQPAPWHDGAQRLGSPASSSPVPHSKMRSSVLLLQVPSGDPSIWVALSSKAGAGWRHGPGSLLLFKGNHPAPPTSGKAAGEASQHHQPAPQTPSQGSPQPVFG